MSFPIPSRVEKFNLVTEFTEAERDFSDNGRKVAMTELLLNPG